MKKSIIIASLLLSFGINSWAQDVKPLGNYSFGIYGGINFQNINGNDENGSTLSNSLVPRFHLGINEEIPIAPEFFAKVGLQFIGKGTQGDVKYTDILGTRTINRNVAIYYIELPVNFVYKPLLGSGHVVLSFGPYVGFGAIGNAAFSGNNAPADKEIQFGSDAPTNDANNLVYFKRWDVGANFCVGYEFSNGINLLLNSQLGLININSNTSSKMTNSNTGFGLSLGYRFL